MDHDFTEQQIEAARVLFAGPCDFMLGVAGLEQLPETDRPEVAFAGRSNVGKSSLVNALTGRKTLARASNTPGRTQQLNFFNLGNVITLVDMPGYGYAKVSKTQIADWTKLIFQYLRGRPNLRCVFVLVDGRHGLKDSDIELMKMLDEAAVSYRVVLTKIDKIKNEELESVVAKTLEALKKRAAAFPGVAPTSAETGAGIPDLRAVIADYA
ncbi:MAG: ribosome biogenesis GTP-binding protein YihA/YsxC [Alphaproteobacteria bacterium]|nr:ribosome biogenesis GTP-binding protein YihA/YsxC [Alphaproteobacteria bacterium]